MLNKENDVSAGVGATRKSRCRSFAKCEGNDLVDLYSVSFASPTYQMTTQHSPPGSNAKRIAMTLNIKSGMIDEYIEHHAHSRAEVRDALHSVGIRNLSLWNWGDRLFYYAEYVGEEVFEKAMERYSEMPGVKDWEELMHKYQDKIPGSSGDVWWQECQLVYYQA